MKLWLDDEREAPEGWIRARTVREALWLLFTHTCEVLSLDHDLGEDQPSGYDLMVVLEESASYGEWLRIPEKFEVHSDNPPGRKNIQASIDAIERMWEFTKMPVIPTRDQIHVLN